MKSEVEMIESHLGTARALEIHSPAEAFGLYFGLSAGVIVAPAHRTPATRI